MNEDEKRQKQISTAVYFRPSAPIDRRDLFSGRRRQIDDVFNAILQAGQHVILFGERGVGKTSLAKVISEIALGVVQFKLLDSGTINCDSTDTFSILWHKIFKELTLAIESSQMGFGDHPPETSSLHLDALLPADVTPDSIRYILTHYLKERSIIIIDEFDRITDTPCKTLLADTIKNLSDHVVNTTIILVGVGDSIDDLFAEHKSIERCLVQIPMPRMSIDELEQILNKGLGKSDMSITDQARRLIAKMSHGLPHFTHLLGLHSANAAIDRDSNEVNVEDVWSANESIVQKPHHLLKTYHKAVTSPQTANLYSKVLLACALTPTDDLGYFSASDVVKPISAIMGKSYQVPNFARHLSEFCSEGRGPILQKTGPPRKLRYRFTDPMMQPFVIIHGYASGELSKVSVPS